MPHRTTGVSFNPFAEGLAYAWKDVFFPQSVPKTTGVGNPSLVTWNGNNRGYSYAIGDANDFDPQEFPHDGKQGSTATWHIHFVSRTNVAAIRYVKWQLEYAQAAPLTAFPVPTTISAEYAIPANTAANTMIVMDIGTFITTNIASIMSARLTRIAASSTAPADDPVVLGVHYHYQVDAPGSREMWTK